ncbi:MAG: 3-deoxy-manno-octulosonate cytidylyltransferase [Candidatus Kapabacteria bacterium]|nr:3-deoxy-manno-octulosonate cytidylyltransferase [Candidatus Kapabacteria bacterium]
MASQLSVMTSAELPSGTDRVAEAVRLRFPEAEFVLNVQGDEPLLHPSLLDALADAIAHGATDVATPVQRITDVADLDNPTICKVTIGDAMRAMYFSRSCIPHVRGAEGGNRLAHTAYWKHIGLYAYKRSALERFISLPQHPYELAEQLEQLRLLAAGATYTCIETSHRLIAIDVPADADTVRDYMLANGLA